MTPLQGEKEKGLKKTLNQFLRGFVSLWILFHLFVLLITPNSASFLGRRYSTWFTSYANQLGFHNMWNFFSPDPASVMIFQSTLRFLDAQGEEVREPVVEMTPPTERKMILDSAQRRLLYATRFFFVYPDLIRRAFVPWQCRKVPGVSRVGVSLTLYVAPSLDKAILQRETPIEDLLSSREIFRDEAACEDLVDGA